MVELKIRKYDTEFKEKWDSFVMGHSVNGTFLQTKNFLDYHGDRFEDASLVIYKGNDTVVAVIPACTVEDDGVKTFHAHCGSTFGGIVVSGQFYDIGHVEAILTTLEDYLAGEGYGKIVLKCTSDIFAGQHQDLLYYFLFQKGYQSYDELSCYIDFSDYNEDIASNFTSGRRRDYKYSARNDLRFEKLETKGQIEDFYKILCDNLQKFDAEPVHTLDEVMEFKEERLRDTVEFYGVFLQDKMIAASMIFLFGSRVFHTQYLAADQECLKLFPMNFLDYNLIKTARDRGFSYFSFGTSTREHGKVLNKKLAEFKEGFGTRYGTNRTYAKNLL